MAVGDENIIEHDVVKISPDLSGFREKLIADLQKAVKGVTATAKVKLVADATGFNLSAKAELAKQAALKSRPEYKIRLVADARGFHGSAKEALRGVKSTATVRIKTAVDKASVNQTQRDIESGVHKAEDSWKDLSRRFALDLGGQRATQANLRDRQAKDEKYAAFHSKITGELSKLDQHYAAEEIRVRHETANAMKGIDDAYKRSRVVGIDAVEKAFTSAERRMKRTAGRSRSGSGSGSADQGLLDRLEFPKLLNFGGTGLRPMNALIAAGVALSPVLIAIASNALQAGTSIAALGTASIGAGLAIGGLTVAFSGVTKLFAAYTAFENETIHASANAAAQTKNQANGYNELADKMLAVNDARDNLVAAQKAETAAQKDINKAREKARRDAVDLRQSILDLRNAEQGDTLTVAEAKQHAASLQADFFATAAMKARANQDVRDAMTQLSDDQLALSQKRADLLKSNRQGIEGSDVVTQAKDAADAAHRHVNSAQHTLNRAVKGLNTTQAGQSNSVSAAQALFNEQMRRASPAARDMLGWYKANEKELQRLARVVQQGVLPGFTRFLDAIEPRKRGKGKTTLALFAEAAGQLGGIIGDVVGKVGKWMNTPFFRKAFGKIQAENAADLTKLGKAALTLLDPITRIVVASAPLAGKLADGIQKFATWFADVIKSADKSGKLGKWFDDAGHKFGVWMDIGHNLLTLLKNLFTFSLPAGDSLVQRLSNFTKTIADWSGSKDGQKSIKDFFDFFRKLDYGRVTSSAVAIGEIVTVWVAAQKLRKISPFQAVLAALAAFAASNPKEAADLLRNMAGFINNAAEAISRHPDVLKFLIAAAALRKVGKAVGFSVKLPVLDGIRKFLVSKFSVLEKFVGGGATTATMTVNAGVVNINGGVGLGGAGGAGGKAATAEEEAAAAGAAGGRGKLASLAAAGIPIVAVGVATGILFELAGQPFEWDPVKDAKNGWDSFKKTLTEEWVQDAGWWNSHILPHSKFDKLPVPGNQPKSLDQQQASSAHWFSITLPNSLNLGAGGSGGWAGLGTNLSHFFGTTIPNSITGNTGGWSKVGKALVDGFVEGWNKTWLKSAYDHVKGWIGEFIGWVKGLFGIKSPSTVFMDIGGQLINGLWAGITSTWLNLFKTITGWIGTNISTPLAALFGGAGTALVSAFVHPFSTLTTELEKPVQTAINWLNDHLIGPLDVLLAAIGVPTIKPIGVASIAASKVDANVRSGLDNIRRVQRRGDGGPIHGWSPHSKADNIPAWLTAKEYVQPVDAVEHYGLPFMEAIRTKQFPRFAGGGLVGGVGAAVGNSLVSEIIAGAFGGAGNLSIKDLAGNLAAKLFGQGGQTSGDPVVASVAEATARALGATDKQLIALFEAGLVESGLRNLNYGDRDSLGFLQQRAGWGSAAQRMNVDYATRKFIAKAKSVDKAGLTAGQLAQAVQVSAYPDRYDMRYADALAVLNSAAPYVGGGGLGGMLGGRGWQWQEAVLRKAFGKNVQFFSTTGGGHAKDSWHYKGRAVDLTPSMAIFDWIKSHYGASTLELIYGPAGIGIKNGQPHDYGKALNAEHGKHIHWAYGNGGLVRRRTYDTGGDLPPGYTLAFNGTGRTERVNTASQQATQVAAIGSGGNSPVRLDRRDLATLAGHIVTAMTGQTITMDGRKVAETVRGYDYLPRGI